MTRENMLKLQKRGVNIIQVNPKERTITYLTEDGSWALLDRYIDKVTFDENHKRLHQRDDVVIVFPIITKTPPQNKSLFEVLDTGQNEMVTSDFWGGLDSPTVTMYLKY